MQIRVTRADIHLAEQGRPMGQWASSCPIARAIRRATGMECTVGTSSGHIYTPQGYPSFTLPEEAKAFIHAFDHGSPVQPFVFDLEVPDGHQL